MPWAAAAAACAAIVGSACSGSGSIPARQAQTPKVLPQSCYGCGAPRESSTTGICAWCRLDWLASVADVSQQGPDRSYDHGPQTTKVSYGFATTKSELAAYIEYDPRGGVPIRHGGGFLVRSDGGRRLQVGEPAFRPSLSGRGSKFQLQRGFAACYQWWARCARWVERARAVCLRAVSR